jgi:hypothetical protein
VHHGDFCSNDGDLVFGDGDSIFGNFQSFHLSLGNLLDFRRMLLNFFGIVVLWCCGDFLDTLDMFVPRKFHVDATYL